MNSITFVTGNAKKAEYLSRFLGFPIEHTKLELDEIQSLSLEEIVMHKVRQAYEKLQKPVLVEDVSLRFHALGGLPGPFIKFFQSELKQSGLCELLQGKLRGATASAAFAYYDGVDLEIFTGSLEGSICTIPEGDEGFGWDQIFIPHWSEVPSSHLSEEEYKRFYLEVKPIQQLQNYFISL